MNRIQRSVFISSVILLTVLAGSSAAQNTQALTTLYSFCSQTNCADGFNPYAGVVQASDGNFYGTTAAGGTNSSGGYPVGTAFKITPQGTLTTLYNFCSLVRCFDGGDAVAALVQASDGNFYGTTIGGGVNGNGVVFQITPTGTLTTLYSFSGGDGAFPYAGLVQASDGNFYGATAIGGAYNACTSIPGYGGCGTVFKITASGTLTTLHSFNGTDGGGPLAGLVEAIDGNFYGTTSVDGAYGYGTVFRITPDGALTTLYSFSGGDGAYPYAGLVQASDGNFYGTTYGGGTNGYGAVFKITPSGTLITLHSFSSADGSNPTAGLVQATDGNFYGTAYRGGANNGGTVFKITPGGILTTLYSFCSQTNCADGFNPYAGVVQASDGKLYGTTYFGGANNGGTVFQLLVFPQVSLSATSLSFGNQILGSSSGTQTVTLSNTSAGDLSITSIAAAGEFAQTNDCGSSLAAGHSCTINVAFLPANAGTRVGTISIIDNAGDSPQTISLAGEGIYNVCVLYDPTKAAKSGNTMPIKLQVCDANNNDVSAPTIGVHATSVVQTSSNASYIVQDSGNANPDYDFRFDSALGPTGGYIFNLKTTGLATGSYALTFTAGADPTTHNAYFQVR